MLLITEYLIAASLTSKMWVATRWQQRVIFHWQNSQNKAKNKRKKSAASGLKSCSCHSRTPRNLTSPSRRQHTRWSPHGPMDGWTLSVRKPAAAFSLPLLLSAAFILILVVSVVSVPAVVIVTKTWKWNVRHFFYFKFFQLHLNNPIKVNSDWPVDLVSAKSGPLILKFNFEIYSNDWVTGEATASAESLNPPIRPDFRRLEASHLIPIFTHLKHFIHFFLNFDYNFWIIYIKLSRVQYNFMQIRRLIYSNHIELHIIL